MILLVPLALLIRQAHHSLERERDLEYRTVAERIVDEMERELSAWLEQEEDRPYSHYRFYFIPEDTPLEAPRLQRSPLSEPSSEPFVVGHFQVDPEGALSSPRRPGNLQLAAQESGWQDNVGSQAHLETLRESLEGFWTPTDGLDKDLFPGLAPSDFRVTSKEVLSKNPDLDPETQPGIEAKTNALKILGSLNRGAQSRKKRASKQEVSQATQVYNFSQEENAYQQSLTASRDTGTTEQEGRLSQAIEETLETQADGTIDVRLEPLVGRPNGHGQWVLYRTVLIGPKAFRQGIVVDPQSLVTWAASRALAGSTVATVEPLPAGQQSANFAQVHSFRFAAPFDGVATQVTVAPLPDYGDGPKKLLLLSALLALAVLVGFFALDRMVTVTVSFAQRRSNFVSSVTHELKTPLTALRMYGEMLRDGVVPSEDKRQQYYDIITRESERLTRLVNNVLALSRLENKQQQLSPTVGSIVPVMEEVAALLRPHVEEKGFTLEIQRDEDLPQVRFDRDAMQQVLFNLVDNALKYSDRASQRHVLLQCRRSSQGGVELKVGDRGPGVSKRHLRKIFEPFYRGENELTRTTQGTGIGLALVNGLVAQMGGTVRGRNRVEGGFEVSIALPGAATA